MRRALLLTEKGRDFPDERALAVPHLREAVRRQVSVRLHYRGGIDPQGARERPYRGQRVTRLEVACTLRARLRKSLVAREYRELVTPGLGT